MPNPRVGKIPPFELIPILYRTYGTSRFNRRSVREKLGNDAYISILRALKDGWLQVMRKVDGVNEYALSGKAMYLIERTSHERGRASC